MSKSAVRLKARYIADSVGVFGGGGLSYLLLRLFMYSSSRDGLGTGQVILMLFSVIGAALGMFVARAVLSKRGSMSVEAPGAAAPRPAFQKAVWTVLVAAKIIGIGVIVALLWWIAATVRGLG